MRGTFLLIAVVARSWSCGDTRPPPGLGLNANMTMNIIDPGQREAAVDKDVAVIGVQTRTKQPQVNGVDVDGAYELSDRKVVARGILRKHVVPEEPEPKDGLHAASRGPGTYYSVVDPVTKQLAKTTLVE